MKKVLFIFFCFLSLYLKGQDVFWVTPRGDDDNAGTDSSSTGAWATWREAFYSASVGPGDTVYFRGGVYPHTDTDGGYGYGYDHPITNGTSGNYVYYWAYPPDLEDGNPPILDSKDVVVSPSVTHNYAIYASGVNWVYFKGLTIRNVKESKGEDVANAWYFSSISNSIFEQCTAYNTGGGGFTTHFATNVYLINCDSYNNCDSLTADYPGNDGTGFRNTNNTTTSGSVYYRYCRAWNNGDQGFSAGSVGYAEYDGCWSWNNGQLEGGGWGFKMSFYSSLTPGILKRLYKNNIALYNRRSGFDTNDGASTTALAMNIYNNTSYHNEYGFRVLNTQGTNERELERTYKNNIAYANSAGHIQALGSYTHDHNSWDISGLGNFTNADFLSVDTTGITGARQADGSLPELNFLKLSSTSRAIDEGTNVGYGDDIGAYQYEPYDPGEEIEPAVVFTTGAFPSKTSAVINATVFDDGGGTVSLRGVVFSTSANPDLTDSFTENGLGTGAYQALLSPLLESTLYYARAYAINEIGTSYGNEISFTTTQGGIVTVIIDGAEYIVTHSDGRIIEVK